jgi:hypothetical protein
VIEPPRWTEEQLAREGQIARAAFRRERLEEPLQRWKEAFDRHRAEFERLFEEFGLGDPANIDQERLVGILRQGLVDPLRYVAGPPISSDDLKTLAELDSLAASAIKKDPEAARRVLDVILQAIDPRRFPWLEEGRPPTDQERAAAILSSAALITAQRVATQRRMTSKAVQEEAVKAFLKGMGFTEQLYTREIRTLSDAPEPGKFCGESLVGRRKADVPVRLFDTRLMPVECKVSNSVINSIKRINNDAAVKARQWREDFGKMQVVPTAVLSGVFGVKNLLNAQNEDGLTIFWAHRLEDMREFIESTKPGNAKSG